MVDAVTQELIGGNVPLDDFSDMPRQPSQIEKALKIFKQRVKESGLLLELKEKSYYTKPSMKRKTQKNLAKLRYKNNSPQEYKKLY